MYTPKCILDEFFALHVAGGSEVVHVCACKGLTPDSGLDYELNSRYCKQTAFPAIQLRGLTHALALNEYVNLITY